MVSLCVSFSDRTFAWMVHPSSRAATAAPRSVLLLQARRGERGRSTNTNPSSSTSSALASSLSASPPNQSAPSFTTTAVMDAWGQPQDKTHVPEELGDRSAYLDPETVRQTVSAVFPSSETSTTINAKTNAKTNTASSSTQESPIYLFDGICNFCDASVHFCFDMDTTATLRFAPLQSPTGRALLQHFGKHPDDTTSLVLVINPDTAYFQSDAVLQTAVRLRGLPAWVRGSARQTLKFVPRAWRNAAYRIISTHRHKIPLVAGSHTNAEPQCRVDLDYARFLDQVVLDAEDSYEYPGHQ